MKEKLRAYIESLFLEAPKTKRAYELKEELFANLSAKFDDLVAKGKSEEEAYMAVVSGIGDMDELIRNLKSGAAAADCWSPSRSCSISWRWG